MAVHSVTLDKKGGVVKVELSAAYRHIFSYVCYLMKKDGSGKKRIAEGNTVDAVPDVFNLPGSPAVLVGKYLCVTGLLTPVQTGPEQDYSLEIHIRQKANEVEGSPIVIAGKLESTIPILEYVKLV